MECLTMSMMKKDFWTVFAVTDVVFQKEAMDKTFEEFFESEDMEFLEFLNAYSNAKGDDAIKESLIALYKKIRTLPFGLKDLRRARGTCAPGCCAPTRQNPSGTG